MTDLREAPPRRAATRPALAPGAHRAARGRRLKISTLIAVVFTLVFGVAYASARPSRPVASTSPLRSGEVAIWSATETPRQPADAEARSVELGTRFSTSAAGTVTALLFYKHRANTGQHIGSLWAADGRRLASVRFTGETATGWQVGRLASPVGLAAGGTYVVSYHAPVGRYADDTGYFGPGRSRSAGPLTATAGVYAYGSMPAMPTSTWRRSNYYVDVAFRTGAAGTQPTTVPSATAAPTVKPTPTAAPSMSTVKPAPSASTTSSSAPASTAPNPAPQGGRGCVDRPSACGYPDASNTGVPAGTALRASSSVSASKAGQVIDGLDITGEINVTAPNVTIRNTRITGGGDYVIIVRDGADNLTIEDTEIQTPAGTPQDIGCVLNVGNAKPKILRVNIHGCSAGVSSGGGLVQDSYIHDMAQKAGLSHDVGVASNFGGGMSVIHNTILNQLSQTAAVAFYQDFGPQSNDLVQDNLLAGGGYCVYGGTGEKGTTSDIRFLDNRFSRKFHPNCGYYGLVADFDRGASGNVWSGNYWDDTLAEAK